MRYRRQWRCTPRPEVNNVQHGRPWIRHFLCVRTRLPCLIHSGLYQLSQTLHCCILSKLIRIYGTVLRRTISHITFGSTTRLDLQLAISSHPQVPNVLPVPGFTIGVLTWGVKLLFVLNDVVYRLNFCLNVFVYVLTWSNQMNDLKKNIVTSEIRGPKP